MKKNLQIFKDFAVKLAVSLPFLAITVALVTISLHALWSLIILSWGLW